jgi:hypothetical protein
VRKAMTDTIQTMIDSVTAPVEAVLDTIAFSV